MKKTIFLFLLLVFLSSCDSYGDNSKKSSSHQAEHIHNYQSRIIETTCMSDGYTYFYCDCGDSYKGNIVHATGHSYIEREQNYKCSKCDRYEDDGFIFELITSDMAKYNASYRGRVNTYDIKSITSTAIERGIVNIPRKHLGCEVTGIYKGSLYYGGETMTELRIPSNIKYIGSNLFCYDGQMNKPPWEVALEKISFNSDCSAMNVSHSCFQYCKKVNDISMPDSCIAIFNHDDTIGNHFIFEDTLFYKDKRKEEQGLFYLFNMLLESDKSKFDDNVIIKNDTRIISNYVFEGNTNIKTVTFPSSLSYIGKRAFAQCVSLSTIIYNGSETQFDSILIEDNSFQDCKTISYRFN